MAVHLTPAVLLQLYATTRDPSDSLGPCIRHALTISPGNRRRCAHLVPLFGEQAAHVQYWDVYLAQARWQGEKEWQQAQAAVDDWEVSPQTALEALPVAPGAADWGLVEALCEASRRRAAENRRVALALATAAVRRAHQAPSEVLGKTSHHELCAHAWATLSNVYRAHDQLAAARRGMTQAMKNLEAAKECFLLGLAPAVLCQRAVLEFWENEPRRSLATLDEALALQPEGHLRARILVQRCARLETLGQPQAALESLQEAIPLISRTDDARLHYCALQHQLLILTDVGRFDEAASVLPEVQRLVAAAQTPAHTLQVQWVEARLVAGQGDFDTAESLYQEVRQGFLQENLAYRAAIVTLELAELLLEQGRVHDVLTYATATLEEFRRQKVESRYISALTLVERAVLRERLTVEILSRARAVVDGHQQAARVS